MAHLRRLLIVLLVILAASPLTAPFATCDLLDLVDGDGTVSVTAIKPPKIHDVVASAASPRPLTGVPVHVATLDAGATAEASPVPQISLPLRL